MSLEARFKNPEAANKFLDAYDATLALWTVPHETLEVTTRFGTTHINVAGSPEMPPLVLIHGAQVSSAMWYANIETLSSHFCVYALDVVDQMGRSVPTRKLKTPQDCVDWLTDVLDELNIEQATIIGHSEGGWQTLAMSILNPERVNRMVLLCPAPAFARLRWRLFLRMIPVFLLPMKRSFYWYFQSTTTMPLDVDNPHPLVEQFIIGVKSFKGKELSLGVGSVFTDEELRQIKMPTLLLVGDQEVVYDPNAVLARARRLIPHIEAELIAGGGHLFPVDQADATNKRMLTFLNR